MSVNILKKKTSPKTTLTTYPHRKEKNPPKYPNLFFTTVLHLFPKTAPRIKYNIFWTSSRRHYRHTTDPALSAKRYVGGSTGRKTNEEGGLSGRNRYRRSGSRLAAKGLAHRSSFIRDAQTRDALLRTGVRRKGSGGECDAEWWGQVGSLGGEGEMRKGSDDYAMCADYLDVVDILITIA